LFEETKELTPQNNHRGLMSPQNSLVLKTNSNVMIGYGGIPITYTMDMRECLPALIPEG
jgi:hypothetical protein